MRPDLREYAERAVEGAPELTPEQVRKLALVIGPAVRRTIEKEQRRSQ